MFYMEQELKTKKETGIVIPLGAIREKDNSIIGTYLSLKKVIEFCKKSNLSIIQLLPVNDTGTHSSPYSGLSAFALHPIYICLEATEGFSELYKTNSAFAEKYDAYVKKHSKPASKTRNRYDYSGILNDKTALLKEIFLQEFENDCSENAQDTDSSFSAWIEENPWIKSYCVFKTLKDKNSQSSWKSWSQSDQQADIEKNWNTTDLEQKKQQIFYAWCQFLCHKQLKQASDFARKNDILLKGDMPILMNEDSCDAWEHRNVFNHALRAGNPPDGDNPNGQNWGFPVYNWKQLKKDNYTWWKNRLISASQYYSAYRLDHLLGFFRIWAVPETDTTAALGHAEPYEGIYRSEINEIDFDDNRIRWLSQPHIPTWAIENITHDWQRAHNILGIFCTRIGQEELWIFKETICGDKEIFNTDLNLGNTDLENQVKAKLAQYWLDRCLIEIEKNIFVPSWTYQNSTAWKSLNPCEREKLELLFNEKNQQQLTLWKNSASHILKSLTNSVQMIPCGEDLGVNLECVPQVMKKHGIFSLKVLRWCRQWEKPGQPYIPFKDYPELSVTVTSVHDSSTIRQWWQEEKDSVKSFLEFAESKEIKPDEEFSPETAKFILEEASMAKSLWCIHPLQDFLYLDKNYYLENAQDERINIPGTVTDFNWTYQLPATIEEISENKELCKNISEICEKHRRCNKNFA